MIQVEQFYDRFADEYTDSVRRCNPCYDEMIQSVFESLPQSWAPAQVLELGCGTGNLTQILRAQFPEASILGVDLSAEALDVCRRRLADPGLSLMKADMAALALDGGRFDLVASSLALHHLSDAQRAALFTKVLSWLRSGGVFTFCDRFKSESEHHHVVNTAIRKELAFRRGATQSEWQRWLEHERDHDTPGHVFDQMNALREIGFRGVECVWRKWTWGTVFARKAR
jgi:tRNA (cmo5U34)-methyltransferase